jgi:ppGpp synthetase/RelA/SpoT-type nucleotidyltranferase
MEGYYAVHTVIRIPVELLDKTWNMQMTSVPVEFQVFTQMQDVIRDLTHPLYDFRRRRPTDSDPKRFWDYQGVQFVPTYLGHLLHYLDGAIMNVRERS